MRSLLRLEVGSLTASLPSLVWRLQTKDLIFDDAMFEELFFDYSNRVLVFKYQLKVNQKLGAAALDVWILDIFVFVKGFFPNEMSFKYTFELDLRKELYLMNTTWNKRSLVTGAEWTLCKDALPTVLNVNWILWSTQFLETQVKICSCRINYDWLGVCPRVNWGISFFHSKIETFAFDGSNKKLSTFLN